MSLSVLDLVPVQQMAQVTALSPPTAVTATAIAATTSPSAFSRATRLSLSLTYQRAKQGLAPRLGGNRQNQRSSEASRTAKRARAVCTVSRGALMAGFPHYPQLGDGRGEGES